MTLRRLGPRICILGPSNSGKSTLAHAVGRACGLTVVHLDQLHHLPGTDWVPRPPEAFVALHDAAVAGERWVMDGNYSSCLPQRLARATGLILLDLSTAASLWRYVRRCWFERDRAGGLEGGRDSVKWDMIRHIAIATRANRPGYARLFAEIDLPKVHLAGRHALDAFCRQEGLDGVG